MGVSEVATVFGWAPCLAVEGRGLPSGAAPTPLASLARVTRAPLGSRSRAAACAPLARCEGVAEALRERCSSLLGRLSPLWALGRCAHSTLRRARWRRIAGDLLDRAKRTLSASAPALTAS